MPTKSRSSTITEPTDERVFGPLHPGEVLREDVMAELGMSLSALAEALGVSVSDLEAIATERAPVTPEFALRVSRYLGTTPEFWMNIQAQFDLESARDSLGARIEREVTPRAPGL